MSKRVSNPVARMRARIAEGLRHASIRHASDWALRYRMMGKPFSGPWTFDHHPWSKGIHDCEAEQIIGQKAAQMGYTEAAINRVFKSIDVDRESVLYVLPTERPDAADFSASRFDPALEMSEHLRNLFSDTKNLGLKRAGSACLYVRSARSRSQLKSIPAARLYIDERDEMEDWSIAMARERASGQPEKSEFMLSTPTVPNEGINTEYITSDQRHFCFKCPHCSRWTELLFPECLEITADNFYDPSIKNSHYKCKECKHKLSHEEKCIWLNLNNADWQPMNKGSIVAGFHVNQMYSFALKPWEFAKNALEAQLSEEAEQEFYNSKLGLPHVIEGSKINDVDLDNCTKDYEAANSCPSERFVTMGVDVGKKLNAEITEYIERTDIRSTDVNLKADAIVLAHFELDDFEELDDLMYRYHVDCAVIDRQPEQRKAKEFCKRFFGQAYTCTYANGVNARDLSRYEDFDDMRVSVDRTSWLDLSLGRFKRGRISIPRNSDKRYRDQIKAPSRVYKRNANGEMVGRYTETSADHYAHSRNYSEIAFKLGRSLQANSDITA